MAKPKTPAAQPLLTANEARALDSFVGQHFAEWVAVAADYLDEGEREDLEAKLAAIAHEEI